MPKRLLNRSYDRLLDYAFSRGCTIKLGSKHYKLMGPDGGLLMVFSNSGIRQCTNMDGLLRKLHRALPPGPPPGDI
jgi:hypothetical protein